MIFPSTLIITKNSDLALSEIKKITESLNQKIDLNNPDLFKVNDQTGWGIDHIRQIKNFLSKKPFNHQSKLVIIENSQNLNSESQNALLKILEEPGENNYIFLIADKSSSLVETIISRCHIIKIKNKQENITKKPLSISGNINKDLAESEKLSSDKTKVLEYLENQLHIFQKKIIENPNLETTVVIKKITKAINMINSNVDPKSTLDYVFLA